MASKNKAKTKSTTKAKTTTKNKATTKAKKGDTVAKTVKTTKAKTTPAKTDSKVTAGLSSLMKDANAVDAALPAIAEEYGGSVYPGVGTDPTDLLAGPLAGLKVNNLDAYVSDQLRNDFIRDENYIRNALNAATNASYDVQRAQALRDAVNAENTNLANTRNAIAEMRRNLIGSASSGANVGATNAAALQALLGLGQQNTQVTTEGLQNVNNVERERAATLAQNAVDAINQANSATNDMYGAATSAYGSDRSYAAQGAAQAVGEVRSARDTNATNERMNNATNAVNKAIAQLNNASAEAIAKTQADANVKAAKLGQKQTVKYINK